MSVLSCTEALARIAALDLTRWDGLPGCSLGDVAAVWRADETGPRETRLGAEAATVQRFDAGDRWLRVWSRDGAVVLIDVDGPLDADVGALGEPDGRLSAHVGFAVYPEGELVFARRGLSLALAESGLVQYVAVFAPTTLDGYTERLRIDRTQRPFPRGGER